MKKLLMIFCKKSNANEALNVDFKKDHINEALNSEKKIPGMK
jgi:hypothetical protein